MPKKSHPAWYQYEVNKAKQRQMKHVGGPSNPDARRGRKKEEYKDWSRPVYKGIVVKARRRGVKNVISKKGFTKPAMDYAKSKGMRLYKGKKRVA